MDPYRIARGGERSDVYVAEDEVEAFNYTHEDGKIYPVRKDYPAFKPDNEDN